MECIGSVGLSLEHDLTSGDEETRRLGTEWIKCYVRITSELGGRSLEDGERRMSGVEV